MTLFVAKIQYGMKNLTKTLQNRIIKETFAKKRMSKALFVQKKKGYGCTDRQTERDRQTDRHTDRDTDLSINYMLIDKWQVIPGPQEFRLISRQGAFINQDGGT